MNFTNTLDHFCIRSARLNIHRPPELVHCGNCGQGDNKEHKLHFSLDTAKKIGVDTQKPVCPECSAPMMKSGPRHFGELHLEVCIDDRVHMPEKFANGEISKEQFESWKGTLTERELLGYMDVKTHTMMVRLDAAEVDLFNSNPQGLVESLTPKIKARLELDAQFQIQHRPVITQHDVHHLFKNTLASLATQTNDVSAVAKH